MDKSYKERSKTPLPALFLTPDSVQIDTQQLMGRQSAGNGFLRAFAQSFNSDVNADLPIVSFGHQHHDALKSSISQAGWKGGVKFLQSQLPQSWDGIELLYYPAPISTEQAWQRARSSTGSFSLCGVTHTICSAGVMKQIEDYLTEPFAAWDALICTSNSVLKAVQRIWGVRQEYLSRRLGTAVELPKSLPMTPVIPLGVHCDDFQFSPAERIAGRAQWEVDVDEVVVLFVGRLSLHAKANPLPMYLACARAAKRSGKKVRFLECGWYANDAIKKTFEDAARVAGVRVTHVDGRLSGVTHRAYAAADIFLSLSDNIQETFGLTPVEAMAAGLPVIVSDWDGYRETVRDGIDGFLIPTTQPSDLLCAEDVSNGYADGRLNYDLYVAHAHMLVSVDIDSCTRALVQLIESESLRKEMGRSGKERAKNVFDWAVVFSQYRDLWDVQNELRCAGISDDNNSQRGNLNPQLNASKLNPLDLFSHYPSGHIAAETQLWVDESVQDYEAMLEQIRSLIMWDFSKTWLADIAFFKASLAMLPMFSDEVRGVTVQKWANECKIPVVRGIRFATWLHKVGLIKVR